MLRLLWRVDSTSFTPQGKRSPQGGSSSDGGEDCEEFGRAVKKATQCGKGQILAAHFERVQPSKETLVRTLK